MVPDGEDGLAEVGVGEYLRVYPSTVGCFFLERATAIILLIDAMSKWGDN